MSHISNFTRFKRLLENSNLNYLGSESILEAKLVPGTAPANQNSVKLEDYSPKEVRQDIKNLQQVQKLQGDLKKSGVLSSIYGPIDKGDVVDALLEGVWRSSPFAPGRDKKAFKDWFKENAPGKKWWTISNETTLWEGFQDYLLKTKARGLSLVKISNPIEVAIDETSGYLNTLGRISSQTGPVKKMTSTSGSNYSYVLKYMNGWNLSNFAKGHQDYYVLPKTGLVNKDDKRDSKGKYVSLTDSSRVNNTKSVYLYSRSNTTIDAINIAKKGGDTKTVGAKAGGEGNMQIAYNNSVWDKDTSGAKIDGNHPLVKQEAQKILKLLTDENDYIDSMTLISSASPVWDSAEQTMELYKKEGKTTEGDSDPGDGTDYASKNAKLAYNRGNQLALALKAVLGDRLPGTMNIKWKISTDEPGGGKHAKYTWNKANDPGKTFKTPAGSRSSGGDKTTEQGYVSGKIFAYRLKFASPTT